MPLNPEAAVRRAAGSADYLRAAFEASPLPMSIGAERRFIAVNPAFERLFGYAAKELTGRSTRVLFASDDEYGRVGATYLAACARGEACHLETELVGREGRRIACLFHVHAIDPNDLSRGVVGIVEDISERKRAEALAAAQAETIAAQTVQLKDSNRFKSEFIARMSHELRTPLNTVLGFAELIEHMTDDPALIRAHAREIHGAGERLRLLVNDMLALAEIEASRAPFAAEPLAPLRLAEAAVRAAQPLAEGRGVALRVVVPPRLPELAGDERKLRLALGHLLANAIKHSPPGAAVTLAARAGDGTAVEFSVEDRGAGISAQDQAKLFRPFVQLEPALTRRHGGSGLGLALVARIAALHEGSAAVHSEPGRGSVFTLRIPLAHKEA